MRKISRLEKTLFRIQAQTTCLNLIINDIKDNPSVVFEVGLGLGRSFDHLNRYLKPHGHRLRVFERYVHSYPDCTPQEDELIIGDIFETLPNTINQMTEGVMLAHCDTGSMNSQDNQKMAEHLQTHLPNAIQKGGHILSDLPLKHEKLTEQVLPDEITHQDYQAIFWYRTY